MFVGHNRSDIGFPGTYITGAVIVTPTLETPFTLLSFPYFNSEQFKRIFPRLPSSVIADFVCFS